VDDPGHRRVGHHRLQRLPGHGSSGTETLLASVGATTTSYTDTGIAPGTTDYYEVTAVNGVGESARSNEKSATVAATVPGAPVLSVTTGTSSVALSWTVPATGGSAITGYNVYRGTAAGTETLLASVGATTISYTDTATTPGTTYYYEVTATNSVGESIRSNEKAATVAATVPGAPVLSATAGTSSVALSWTVPATGGSAITGYNVYRGTAAGTETLLASVGPTTYTDSGLAPGTTDYYEVTATNSVGESIRSNEKAATVAATVPGAPVLSATAGTSSVALSWSVPATGGSAITGYNVYRGTAAGTETLLASVGPTTYTDSGLAPGTTDYYEVTAVNGVGESIRSNEKAATVAATAPAAPVLSATAGTSSVALSWSVPANGGSVITGYNIYRGTASGTETLLASVGATTTSYTDTATAPGTTYYYEVTATNGVGESIRSNEKAPAIAATAPAAPVLSATAGTSSVALSWSVPANGGSAITGYNIYRGTASGTETLLASVGATTISYTDTATAPGATYYYEVTATNGVGESIRSNEKAPAIAATAPGAPVLSATAGTSSAALSWSVPANGGSVLTGYNVYRGTVSGTETLLASVGATSTSYTDAGIAPGTTDYYEVTAVNSVGESARSNEKAATVAATAPGAPVLSASAGTSSVALSWSVPANGGSAITGYNIYRGTARRGPRPCWPASERPPSPTPTPGSLRAPPTTTRSPPSTAWVRVPVPTRSRPPWPPPLPLLRFCRPRTAPARWLFPGAFRPTVARSSPATTSTGARPRAPRPCWPASERPPSPTPTQRLPQASPTTTR
jgi:fibronectin type 3 domain-containing protein